MDPATATLLIMAGPDHTGGRGPLRSSHLPAGTQTKFSHSSLKRPQGLGSAWVIDLATATLLIMAGPSRVACACYQAANGV